MGVYHTIAVKIEGQVKPEEAGEVAMKELELVCAKYGLNIVENRSGCCSQGFDEEEKT